MKLEVEASTNPPTRCNWCEPIKRSTPRARTSGKGRPAPAGRRCDARAHRTRAEGRSGCSGQGNTFKWVMSIPPLFTRFARPGVRRQIVSIYQLIVGTGDFEQRGRLSQCATELNGVLSLHLPVFNMMLFRLVALLWFLIWINHAIAVWQTAFHVPEQPETVCEKVGKKCLISRSCFR